MPIRNLLLLLGATLFCVACAIQSRNMRYGNKVGQAIRLVEDYYFQPVDANDLYQAAMKGIITELDPNCDFIPPQNYGEFQSAIEQQFGGIGITVEGPPAVKRLTVINPIPNAPAYRAGIQAGDTILSVDGVSTEGLDVMQATKLLRGKLGTSVRLLVQRIDSSQTLELQVTRENIQVASVLGDRIQADSKWNYFLQEDPRIAYIRVTMFGDRTAEEFRQALQTIQSQARALIIDLRFNPGGVLPAAVDMADMLLEKGTIVRTQGRRTYFDSERQADSDIELDRSLPIIVLVNEESASASEIMAGALQDLDRAKVGGSRSYGKGTVQQVFEIESDTSALKFTIAKFLRPNGQNIHRDEGMTDADTWGITPDSELLVPMTESEQLYLHRRWQRRSDLRELLRGEHPPEPPFAADPQLRLSVEYLRTQIDSASASNQPVIKIEQDAASEALRSSTSLEQSL